MALPCGCIYGDFVEEGLALAAACRPQATWAATAAAKRAQGALEVAEGAAASGAAAAAEADAEDPAAALTAEERWDAAVALLLQWGDGVAYER